MEGSYPQNDFFNLNETFLEGYKDRLLKPTIALANSRPSFWKPRQA